MRLSPTTPGDYTFPLLAAVDGMSQFSIVDIFKPLSPSAPQPLVLLVPTYVRADDMEPIQQFALVRQAVPSGPVDRPAKLSETGTFSFRKLLYSHNHLFGCLKDNTIQIMNPVRNHINADTLAPIHSIPACGDGHCNVLAMEYVPHNHTFVTSTSDLNLRVYPCRAKQHGPRFVNVVTVPICQVDVGMVQRAVRWDPHTNSLYSGGRDGTVLQWKFDNDYQVAMTEPDLQPQAAPATPARAYRATLDNVGKMRSAARVADGWELAPALSPTIAVSPTKRQPAPSPPFLLSPVASSFAVSGHGTPLEASSAQPVEVSILDQIAKMIAGRKASASLPGTAPSSLGGRPQSAAGHCQSRPPRKPHHTAPAETAPYKLHLKQSWRGHTDAVMDILTCTTSSGAPRVFSAGLDSVIVAWDPNRPDESKPLLGHTKGIYCLAHSPENRYLFSSGFEYGAYVWVDMLPNVPPMILHDPMRPHRHSLLGVVAMPNRPEAVTCDVSGMAKVWDLRMFRAVDTFTVPVNVLLPNLILYQFASTPGNTLLGAMHSRTMQSFLTVAGRQAKVWDGYTAAVVWSKEDIVEQEKTEISALCLSESGRSILLGLQNGAVLIYLFADGKLVRRCFLPKAGEVSDIVQFVVRTGSLRQNTEISRAIPEPSQVQDSQGVLVVAHLTGEVAVWVDDRDVPIRVMRPGVGVPGSSVKALAYSQGNSLLYFGGDDGCVFVYHVNVKVLTGATDGLIMSQKCDCGTTEVSTLTPLTPLAGLVASTGTGQISALVTWETYTVKTRSFLPTVVAAAWDPQVKSGNRPGTPSPGSPHTFGPPDLLWVLKLDDMVVSLSIVPDADYSLHSQRNPTCPDTFPPTPALLDLLRQGRSVGQKFTIAPREEQDGDAMGCGGLARGLSGFLGERLVSLRKCRSRSRSQHRCEPKLSSLGVSPFANPAITTESPPCPSSAGSTNLRPQSAPNARPTRDTHWSFIDPLFHCSLRKERVLQSVAITEHTPATSQDAARNSCLPPASSMTHGNPLKANKITSLLGKSLPPSSVFVTHDASDDSDTDFSESSNDTEIANTEPSNPLSPGKEAARVVEMARQQSSVLYEMVGGQDPEPLKRVSSTAKLLSSIKKWPLSAVSTKSPTKASTASVSPPDLSPNQVKALAKLSQAKLVLMHDMDAAAQLVAETVPADFAAPPHNDAYLHSLDLQMNMVSDTSTVTEAGNVKVGKQHPMKKQVQISPLLETQDSLDVLQSTEIQGTVANSEGTSQMPCPLPVFVDEGRQAVDEGIIRVQSLSNLRKKADKDIESIRHAKNNPHSKGQAQPMSAPKRSSLPLPVAQDIQDVPKKPELLQKMSRLDRMVQEAKQLKAHYSGEEVIQDVMQRKASPFSTMSAGRSGAASRSTRAPIPTPLVSSQMKSVAKSTQPSLTPDQPLPRPAASSHCLQVLSSRNGIHTSGPPHGYWSTILKSNVRTIPAEELLQASACSPIVTAPAPASPPLCATLMTPSSGLTSSVRATGGTWSPSRHLSPPVSLVPVRGPCAGACVPDSPAELRMPVTHTNPQLRAQSNLQPSGHASPSGEEPQLSHSLPTPGVYTEGLTPKIDEPPRAVQPAPCLQALLRQPNNPDNPEAGVGSSSPIQMSEAAAEGLAQLPGTVPFLIGPSAPVSLDCPRLSVADPCTSSSNHGPTCQASAVDCVPVCQGADGTDSVDSVDPEPPSLIDIPDTCPVDPPAPLCPPALPAFRSTSSIPAPRRRPPASLLVRESSYYEDPAQEPRHQALVAAKAAEAKKRQNVGRPVNPNVHLLRATKALEAQRVDLNPHTTAIPVPVYPPESPRPGTIRKRPASAYVANLSGSGVWEDGLYADGPARHPLQWDCNQRKWTSAHMWSGREAPGVFTVKPAVRSRRDFSTLDQSGATPTNHIIKQLLEQQGRAESIPGSLRKTTQIPQAAPNFKRSPSLSMDHKSFAGQIPPELSIP
eukprot:gene3870-98_t